MSSRDDDACEVFSWAGCEVRIYTDEDSEGPRSWSNVGVQVAFCANRTCTFDRVATPGELAAIEGGGWEGLRRHLAREHGATVVLPISMMDHSGVRVWVGSGPAASDSAGWDSGLAGFTFDTAAGRDTCGTVGLENVEACLRDEVATINAWLTGDVYGYVVTGPGHRPEVGKAMRDSCWGFYGLDYCIAEAKGVAESMAAEVASYGACVDALLERIGEVACVGLLMLGCFWLLPLWAAV